MTLAGSHRGGTSKANCYPRSSHAPFGRPGLEHPADCQRTSRMSASVGKVVFRSMNSVMTSAVFKPIDKRVTSKNSRFCICEDPSPVRVAAYTAVHCHEVPARRRHFPPEPVQASLQTHRCGCCCCCCWGCCVSKVQHNVQSVFTALFVLSLSSFFLHFSPSVSLAKLWVSSTLSSSRACSAALLAARQIRRRPRAVRMCGPLSTRIHHAFLHHVMCLFDTSFSSYIEFSFLASTHFSCAVTSFTSSCPSWASTSLSSSRSS